ncbi:hypothetical protein [Wenjunlia tyrosinilytica]|uniref:SLATT domain-containing protein n=1 Tax=Wenjunlia tyrosinilytica TaxID=1544741 RepID=A0A917ZJA9_9ACTN|nr:hypothetical protein [Wenjunlia tyrosinilytica]GGO83828.1 hypothetical protein GCM10012280_13860 [Wenjunlia tyrosinilytica]
MTESSDGTTASRRAELERLRDEAERQRRISHRRVAMWGSLDIVLGFPAAVLAAVSGATGLATADARVPAALLALISAGFAAGASFLRSDVRQVANKRSRSAWTAVEAEARLALADEVYRDPQRLHRALRHLFDGRQAAMAAYEGEAPNGNGGPRPDPAPAPVPAHPPAPVPGHAPEPGQAGDPGPAATSPAPDPDPSPSAAVS